MRRPLWIGVCVMLLCAWLVAKPAAADKYALLVGVDDYAPEGESNSDLYSCETDAYLMREVLVEKYGFAQSNVRVLLSLYPGEEATGENIVNAFREHLIDQAESDDVVVFYFSGHGTRVDDISGDEIDGYDEALCPADVTETNEVLTDDQLDFLLGQLRTDHVTVIADSCHAGTVTCAPEPVERVTKFIPFSERVTELSVVGEVFPQYQPPTGPVQDTSELMVEVVLAACQPWETSSAAGISLGISGEERRASLMTSYLYRVLQEARPQATWQEIFRMLQIQMASACDDQQHPMVEGPDKQPVFSVGEPGEPIGASQFTPCPGQHIRVLAIEEAVAAQLAQLPFVQTQTVDAGGFRMMADFEILPGPDIAIAPADVLVTSQDADEFKAWGDVDVVPSQDAGEFKLIGPISGGLLTAGPLQPLPQTLFALFQFRRTGMLSNPFPGFTVSLRPAKGEKLEKELNEALALELQSTADAYITLFTLGPDGTVRPALVDQAVRANEVYQLPCEALPVQVSFESPSPWSWGGTGSVKLIATLEPLGLDPNVSTDRRGASFLAALIEALSRLVGDPNRPDMLRCEGWTDATAYFHVRVLPQ